MGMLPVRQTCQVWRLKAVAAGRNVLNTYCALVVATQLLPAFIYFAIFTSAKAYRHGQENSLTAEGGSAPAGRSFGTPNCFFRITLSGIY